MLHHEDAVPHADVAVDFHEWQAYGVYRQLVLGARLQRVEHLDGRGVPLGLQELGLVDDGNLAAAVDVREQQLGGDEADE